MDRPLGFGVFLAPFHPAGQNPTLALQRDLETIGRLDELGYDEAWIGEHHSAGAEIIAFTRGLHPPLPQNARAASASALGWYRSPIITRSSYADEDT